MNKRPATMYVGTKVIFATNMSRGEYNTYRGWTVPADENPDDEGYLVEYKDGGAPNDTRHAGYITWSPKNAFDSAYRPTAAMTFGLALEAAQKGYVVTRPGLGVNVVFMSGMELPSYNTLGTDRKVNDRTAKFIGKDTPFFSKPYLSAYTVTEDWQPTGDWQPGWLPSIEDLLATDWVLDLNTTP